MKNIYPKKRWIELEIWLVDKNQNPIFPKNKDWITAYETLTNQMDIDNALIKPEVINHMVEIVSEVHSNLELAKKQILDLLNKVKRTAKQESIYISRHPRINIDKNNIDRNQIIDCCVTDKDYYKNATQEIIKVLEDPYDLLWAWTLSTHIHMSAENDEATFELFKLLSNYCHKLRNWWKNPEKMLMNKQRFEQRNKIIEARKKLWHIVNGIDPFEVPDNYMTYIENNLFHSNGTLKRMHNIIALKKPWDRFTVELRSPDGATTAKQLNNVIEFTKGLIKKSIY